MDLGCLRPVGWSVVDERRLPLGDGPLIDPVAPRQRPQALLTILYCSTDRLCRCGAAVKDLAHSASFHAGAKSAPSNSGLGSIEQSRASHSQSHFGPSVAHRCPQKMPHREGLGGVKEDKLENQPGDQSAQNRDPKPNRQIGQQWPAASASRGDVGVPLLVPCGRHFLVKVRRAPMGRSVGVHFVAS